MRKVIGIGETILDILFKNEQPIFHVFKHLIYVKTFYVLFSNTQQIQLKLQKKQNKKLWPQYIAVDS